MINVVSTLSEDVLARIARNKAQALLLRQKTTVVSPVLARRVSDPDTVRRVSEPDTISDPDMTARIAANKARALRIRSERRQSALQNVVADAVDTGALPATTNDVQSDRPHRCSGPMRKSRRW